MAESTFWKTPAAEELDALAAKPTEPPPLTVPDPEPEVLARAQVILDEMNKGVPFSTQSTEPVAPELTEEQRLQFVRHVVAGQLYYKNYSLIDGQLKLVFVSITALAESLLTRVVMYEEQQKKGTVADRNVRYTNYLMWWSLATCHISGVAATVRNVSDEEQELDAVTRDYFTWFSRLSRVQYRLMLDCFNEFEREVQGLLEKANDPSFWPTR